MTAYTHLHPQAQENIRLWLNGHFDEAAKTYIKDLSQTDPQALEDAFYTRLSFGTGGLRGIMGIGANRINRYTIGFATQGLAHYLKKQYGAAPIRLAIAYDSRLNSQELAGVCADILSANGIEVFLFSELRPTPELSFSIRHLGCRAGIVITASHNPKEYNGYKVYGADGGQIVPPHDRYITEEITRIYDPQQVLWKRQADLVHSIGREIDKVYLDTIRQRLIHRAASIQSASDLRIVYTPLHGTGGTLIPSFLKDLGFKNVHIVAEQAEPDGHFPSLTYPNPEESSAMALALKAARKIQADILIGTDPDSDRIGVGIAYEDDYLLLNGNQTAALLFDYVLHTQAEKGLLQKKDFVVKSIVTSDIITRIAQAYQVDCYEVLTGFKWVADFIAQKKEGRFIIGGEESFGISIGDFVRDKDAVAATALFCEWVAYLSGQGQTPLDALMDLYTKYGFYYETLHSVTKKGLQGANAIKAMMHQLRNIRPDTLIAGHRIIHIKDYEKGILKNLQTQQETPLHFPRSNVLQFTLDNGAKISARPSGTEPKIKFYFSVCLDFDAFPDYAAARKAAEALIATYAAAMPGV